MNSDFLSHHPALRARLAELAAQLPDPARALRLARYLIPLSIVTGLVTEPLLRWFLRLIGAGA